MEIMGKCTICHAEGKTEIHHIISQAKIERIKPHEHGGNLDLKTNPGNLIELCVPCHDLTSHSWYRAKMIAEGKSKTVRKKGKKVEDKKAKKFSFAHSCFNIMRDYSRVL